MRSKLLDITIKNLGCIGSEGLTIALDNMLCLVGNNNTGKSTVLRAYELAVGSERYDISRDRHNSSNENTTVEITVHIPEGVGNIAEKWKVIDGDLHIVKSKWTWDETGSKIRQTFDPTEGEYSEDGNAAGLDNVFTSRLPKPFRVGALEGPEGELKELLKLIVEPISQKLKKNLADVESEMSKALELFNLESIKPVEEEQAKIDKYNKELTDNHSLIFPNLSIDLTIGISEFKIDPVDALIKGSSLNIKEFEKSVQWVQQGTGSQRALFWSLLQVRSKLQTINDLKIENEKKIGSLKKENQKLEREKSKAAKEETKESKQTKINENLIEIKKLTNIIAEDVVGNGGDDIMLPGYMLLIDEPEIALHPNGIRAASKVLYDLAKDSAWQVMLSTHSPLFINPFEDNTTIVRLSREGSSPSPKTYRSDNVNFSDEEKDQLTLLNTFDQNLAEMFFGQKLIIVEGDTEFAAFNKIFNLNLEKYPLGSRPLIIRARGKFTISPLIKMLKHLKVDFSILHDSDYPKTKKDGINGVWTYNDSLYCKIQIARDDGIMVIHRISISTFEIEHLGVEVDLDGNVELPSSKNKPYEMFKMIGDNDSLKLSVEKTLDELLSIKSNPFPFGVENISGLEKRFNKWVVENGISDPRFILDKKTN